MKMAKKVLSVVLALVMALSCFAVAGSAFSDDPATATYHAKIALKGAVGTGSWDVDDGPDFEIPATTPTTKVTAEKGDVVYVFVYGETDYYIHDIVCQVFFPASFQTPGDMYKASDIATYGEEDYADWPYETQAAQARNIFFGDSTLCTAYGTSSPTYASYTEWLLQSTDRTKPSCWPTDSQGKIISGYGSETTPDTDKWHFTRYTIAGEPGNPNIPQPVMMDDITTGKYTFCLPLYIPEDVADGTYRVTIPIEVATCANKIDGRLQITKAKGKVTSRGWNGDFQEAEWKYSDEQYFDCSEAVLEIQVGESQPETQLDWTDLDDACTAAASITNATKAGGKDTTYTDASWSAFNDARIAANTENAAHACTTQDDIDALTTDLTGAQEDLTAKAIYTDLTNLFAACEEAYEAGEEAYDSGWDEFATAYGQVDEFLSEDDNLDLPYDDGQETIDDLYTALKDAKDALHVKPGDADFSDIDYGIEEFKDYYALGDTTGAKYYSNWAEFKAVYEPVLAIYNNKTSYTADNQDDIDKAADSLLIFELVENDADYTALTNVLSIAATKKQADYTEASWSVFAAKKTAAEGVEKDLKAKDQGIIDTAANDLSSAITGLKLVCDYTALDSAIAAVPAYTQDYYTKESWSAYQVALTDAQAVARGLEATTENEALIKAAADELVDKFGALTVLDADWTNYDKAIDDFEGLKESWYTTTTWAAAKSAYDTAKGIDKSNYNKANQGALDAIVGALTKAMGDLKIADADKSTLSANLDTAQGKVDGAIAPSKTFTTIGKTFGGVNIYTDETYQALTDAMTAGKSIMDNTTLDARDQADIDKAAKDVADAITGLKCKDTDWTVADELMAAAKAALDNAAAYDSVETLQSRYNTAKANIIDKKASNYATWDKIKNAQLNALGNVDTALAALTLKTFDITYKYVDEKGATVTGVTNTNAATYQYSATDAVTIDLAKITKDGYTTTSATPSSIVAGSTGNKEITVVLTSNEVPTYDITYKYVDDKGETVTGVDAMSAPTYFTAEDEVSIFKGYFSKEGYTVLSVNPELIPAGTQTAQEVIVTLKKNTYTITYKYVDENEQTLENVVNTNEESYAYGDSFTVDTSLIRCTDSNYEFVSVTPETIAAGTNAPVEITVKFQLKAADYSALTNALAAASSKVRSKYTDASWAVLAKAVEDAGKIAKNLKITDQQIITDAADAITGAINKLVEKQIEAKGSVTKVDFVAETGHTHDFTVTVQGRASMVQFMELTTGGTRSYDRYHEKVSITSYKYDLASGTYVECDDMDSDLAYEVWTITTPVDGPEIGVRVKNAGSSKWENADDAYKFTYAVELKTAVISAELTADPERDGGARAKVVTGSDVEYIQFKSETGATVTLGKDKATTDESGNLVFTGKAYFTVKPGEKSVVTIRTLANGKWETSETTLSYTFPSAE